MPASYRSWSEALLILLLTIGPMSLLGQPVPATATPTTTLDTTRTGKTSAEGTVLDRTGKEVPAAKDSLAAPKSRADTVLVVKHSFNHRQQIITGSVVMTCLALMMVVMNNYNPR